MRAHLSYAIFISSFMCIFFDPDIEGFVRKKEQRGKIRRGGAGRRLAVGEKSVMCQLILFCEIRAGLDSPLQ